MAGRSGAAQFDGTLYAENTAHHRAFDDAVLQPLALRPGARVLDLGCGVGDLTARVADVVLDGGSGLVVGLDLSASNIAGAQQRWGRPGLQLRVGALQRLSEVVPEKGFDAVLSAATLHWAYAALLDAAQLATRCCRLVHQRRAMADAAALEGWLRSQVLPAYEPWLPTGGGREPLLADVVNRCPRALRRDDGSFDQDYVRLDVVASLESS